MAWRVALLKHEKKSDAVEEFIETLTWGKPVADATAGGVSAKGYG